jgi:hypothetical protein
MRDIGKKRADREVALRGECAERKGTVDIIDQMRKEADSQIERSNKWKTLADAAQPLYTSLNDQQSSASPRICFTRAASGTLIESRKDRSRKLNNERPR